MAKAGRTGGGVKRPAEKRSAETRRRLVAAAARTIHELGYANTTLAKVAAAAKVPLGNVYYHFRTKDSLAEAVLDSYVEQLRARFAAHGRHARPEDRIVAMLDSLIAEGQCHAIARHGCPHGSLAQELDKGDKRLGGAGRRLVEEHLDWYEAQFEAMGLRRRARSLAVELFSGIQGAALVGSALFEPRVIEERLAALKRWVRGLARR